MRSTEPVVVSDDGTGPRLCFGSIPFDGPPSCSDVAVRGWDWSEVGESSREGVRRWGAYTLTGTFDGETFEVTEVAGPGAPEPYDVEIPCPTPAGGWTVQDPGRTSRNDLAAAMNRASRLDGFATAAVSAPDGAPGPEDPASTVFSVFVVGDVRVAEAAVREVWGGMLCVTQVEHTDDDFHRMQARVLEADVPGITQVGGNLADQLEIAVLHDDGSIQRWADGEFGEGVAVVLSNLQPAR